tara:strand:+ start:9054 stop:9521 length:468 start_codon:yes stop_codon:yes gene_type:complete
MKGKTGIRFDRSQLDFLKKAEQKLAKASAKAISQTGSIILKKVKGFASKKAYSLDDLSALDHPYAKRHGNIKGLSDRKKFEVGTSSGKFMGSIQGNTTNQYEYAITYKPNDEVSRIVLGTRVMLPRDPITEGFKTKEVKSLFVKTLRTQFKKAVK